MKFRRIFVEKGDCRLWSSIGALQGFSKPVDVFKNLFDQWNDTAYLYQFFQAYAADLADPFWRGMSIDEAIDQVRQEALDFEIELRNMDTGHPAYGPEALSNIFQFFDKDMYLLQGNNLHHKKAKPDLQDSMIRIYAAEFDGAYIVTGGLLKLTKQLTPDAAAFEKAKMKRVLQYLKSEKVYSRLDLDTI
jgi:hypothetical protein